MALTEKNRDLLKMLGGTVVTVITAVWILAHQLHSMESRLNEKIAGIDKRVTVIETVLMYQRCPMNHIAVTETMEKKNG